MGEVCFAPLPNMHLLKLPKNVRGGCQSSFYGLHVEPMDLDLETGLVGLKSVLPAV